MILKYALALAAWYVSAVVVYHMIPPSFLRVLTIDIAWIGPFVVVAVNLSRGATLDRGRHTPLRSEAAQEAVPAHPRLADRA